MTQEQRIPITLPAKTRATLETAVQQHRMLQAQIDAIVMTARDLLGVPDDYVLQSLEVGFEAPVQTNAQATEPA